jgi:hypothetical protein
MQIKSVIASGLILLLSCQSATEKKVEPENSQQEHFIKFLTKSCETYESQSNDIQRREYFIQFEKDIVKLSDTLGVFNNWKGTIKRIKTFDWSSQNSTELDVEIEIKLSEYQDITFISKRFFNNKNIDSNLTYRQLKNLTTGSTVYFDGFVARDADNKIDYDVLMTSDNRDKICDPDMKFYIISIGKDKLQFTTTDKFKKVNSIQMDVWKTMEDKVSKRITESQFKNKLNDYKKQLDPLVASFTPEEKAYVQSFTDCLVSQFYAK